MIIDDGTLITSSGGYAVSTSSPYSVSLAIYNNEPALVQLYATHLNDGKLHGHLISTLGLASTDAETIQAIEDKMAGKIKYPSASEEFPPLILPSNIDPNKLLHRKILISYTANFQGVPISVVIQRSCGIPAVDEIARQNILKSHVRTEIDDGKPEPASGLFDYYIQIPSLDK